MIEEENDCPEDYDISQNSPKSLNCDLDESNLITDFSSPIKCDLDIIADSSSPEINFHKYNYVNKPGTKRKRSSSKRSLCNSVKRPSLNINISKRSSINGSIKGSNIKGEVSFYSAGCNRVYDDKNDESNEQLGFRIAAYIEGSNIKEEVSLHSTECNIFDDGIKDSSYIEHKLCKSNEELGLPERIEENLEEVNPEILQIDEHSQDLEKTNFDRTSNISIPTGADENLCNFNNNSTTAYSCQKEIQRDCLDQPDTSAPRPSKIKKGTLLERASKVATLIKNEAALYSHELTVGLRSSRGSFVSDVLVVKAIHTEETCLILRCIPEIYDSTRDDYDKTLFIYVSRILHSKIQENSCIVVHFPVIAMFDAHLNCHFVFASERVQLISRNHILQTENNSIIFRNQKFNPSFELSKYMNATIFRSLKSRISKRVLDAVVGNPLVLYHSLQLKVLHLYSIRLNDESYYRLLTIDLDNQNCIIQFKEGEHKDALDIHPGHVYQFIGFCMTQYMSLNRELRSVIEHYSSLTCKQDFIYIMEPKVKNWQVNL